MNIQLNKNKVSLNQCKKMVKAIRSLHSIPGHFKKVRARVRKEQSTFAKNLKDRGFRKVGKIKDYKKIFYG